MGPILPGDDALSLSLSRYEHARSGAPPRAAAPLFRNASAADWGDDPHCDYGAEDLAAIHATLGPALAEFGYALERRRDLP